MTKLLVLLLVATTTPAFADAPVKKPVCTDAELAKYKADGLNHLSNGEDAAALVSFEKAYTCKVDVTLLPRMVLAACKSANAKKAQLYYDKCNGACKTLTARCETQHIILK